MKEMNCDLMLREAGFTWSITLRKDDREPSTPSKDTMIVTIFDRDNPEAVSFSRGFMARPTAYHDDPSDIHNLLRRTVQANKSEARFQNLLSEYDRWRGGEPVTLLNREEMSKLSWHLEETIAKLDDDAGQALNACTRLLSLSSMPGFEPMTLWEQAVHDSKIKLGLYRQANEKEGRHVTRQEVGLCLRDEWMEFAERIQFLSFCQPDKKADISTRKAKELHTLMSVFSHIVKTLPFEHWVGPLAGCAIVNEASPSDVEQSRPKS